MSDHWDGGDVTAHPEHVVRLGEDGYPGSDRWCLYCSCGELRAGVGLPTYRTREQAVEVYHEHLIELGLMEAPSRVKPEMTPVQQMMAEGDGLVAAANRLYKKARETCTEHTEDGGDWYVHCVECRIRLGARCPSCKKTTRVQGCMSPCDHCGKWSNL